MKGTLDTYWEKQAVKHERIAETLRIKAVRTGERQWLKQADSNARKAQAIRNCPANFKK